MKRYIHGSEDIFAMANVNKCRTGLNVNIWSDGQGCTRNKPDIIPRVKIVCDDAQVSVSISENLVVLAPKDWESRFQKSEIDAIKEGMNYVSRNHGLFMKHYMDRDLSFDDSDLFDELKKRGRYK